MHLKRHILLFMCLLTVVLTHAQEVQKAPLRVIDAGNGVFKVHFQLPGLRLTATQEGFCRMVAPGMMPGNGSIGSPDLPTASILVHIPAGGTLTVQDATIEGRIVEIFVPADSTLAPIDEGWVKGRPRPGHYPDMKIYGADGFYRGGELLEVEHIGRMADEELYRLTVRPVAYNPTNGVVRLSETVEGELRMLAEIPQPLPGSARRLLIVSRPEFEIGIQPFVQWKRQEGYDVEVLYVNTHRRDSIKEQIRPYFNNASLLEPAPNYILLIGDAAQIQSFIGETDLDGEGHTTDLYYSEFTGDYLPEAMLGRWPVNDTAELRIVVEKTLRYEQFRDMDTLQLKRMLLVAGNEQNAQAPLTTNGQVNYVSREVKLAHPEIDTICYHNPESANQLNEIQADIGQGAGLLNYTAHCTTGGWTSPALTIGRVEEASGTQPMVYVNNCCKSNIFGGTCFGEQLLRLPRGGAVGVIGATNATLWYEDYYWAVGPKCPISLTTDYDSLARGAFDALMGRQPSITTMGELLSAGNLAVMEQGTSYAKLYWEIYCLLGDPTLRPWIGVPQPIDLEIVDTLRNGQSEISLNGTTGASVTAMQDGEVIGRAAIDASGSATLQLSRTIDTLPLILTATGAGLWPRFDTLTVEANVAFGATLREVEVSDTAISCVVENIGLQRIDSLSIFLTQQGSDTLNSALLEEQQVIIDSLLPGEQIAVALPVHVSTIGSLPLWQASLIVREDRTTDLCRLTLRHSIPVTYPTLSLKLLDARGREVRRIKAGHDYRLKATCSETYDSLILCAKASTSNSLWTATDDTLSFTTPDSLCALAIDATSFLGLWHDRQHYWLEPGNRIESFEHGFDSHPWRHDNHIAWTLDSTVSRSGQYSARSGAIGDGQTTKLCLDVEMLLRDTISYWVKTSTENGGDKLIFSVDGRDFIPEAWGITDWSQRVHLLEAGHHTLCWRYRKNTSGSQGNDCIWIDDLQIPLAKWDTAYVWDCIKNTVGIDHSPFSIPHSPLTIYPNPSAGQVWIDCRQECAVRISDALGRLLVSYQLKEGETRRWDTSALPAGIYFATTTVGDQQNTQKIILLNP